MKDLSSAKELLHSTLKDRIGIDQVKNYNLFSALNNGAKII